MEYQLQKQSVPVVNLLLDTVGEEPVDAELTLPDYCADIERILRCSLIPQIDRTNLSADRLSVDGSACIRVMYLDSDEGGIRSYEHTVPFSHHFPIKDSPADYALSVSAKPEYLNCRAMSPRKLSLHGAFSLYAKVAVKEPLCYYTYEEDDDLMTDSRTLCVSEARGLCSEVFDVHEDIPFGSMPPAAALLSHRLSVRITELKAIPDKLMLSAEGRLELLYQSDREKGSVETMTYQFPLSRIIDCEGAGEKDAIDARLDVNTYDLSLSDDALDGSSMLNLSAKLCCNAICRQDRELCVIADCFSTKREVKPSLSRLNCRCGTRCLRYTKTDKAQLQTDGDRIAKVIDVCCERITASAAISGGAVLVSSKAEIGVLYENSEGETRYLRRDASFDDSPSDVEADAVDAVSTAVDSLSFRIVDEKTLELQVQLCYQLTVSRCCTAEMITAVTAEDDAPERESDGALVLYYADKGERIWSIAKRFSSRPSDIEEENELISDALDSDMMLLIPTA